MKIGIIGGGIGGLCTAIALQNEGVEVSIYESAPSVKSLGAGLVLSANAMQVLALLNLEAQIVKAGKVLRRLSVLDERGRIITARNTTDLVSRFGIDNFTIHRGDLHKILLSPLKINTLFSDHKCVDIEEHNAKVSVYFENGKEEIFDAVIAADGIHSVVRKKFEPQSSPRYSGYTCWRGIINSLPAGFDGENFSETWGAKGRFGVVPLSDNRIYWYACLNAGERDESFGQSAIDHLRKVFKEYHFPIPQILALSEPDHIIHNDIIDLKPLKKFAFGRVLLVGDAAHATTPNMGQGACQAIEDAWFATQCLKKSKVVEEAFKRFEELRIARTTRIVNTSQMIGKMAQLDKTWLCRVRNLFLRLLPDRLNQKQLEFLYNVNFKNT